MSRTPSPVAISLADLIAFAREQAAAVESTNFTQLETGLIDKTEAQRRHGMAEGIVLALEAFRSLAPDGRPDLAARAATMRRGGIPTLHVLLRCGPAIWADSFIAADIMLMAPSVRQTVVGIVEARMAEIIEQGSKRDV